MTTVLLSEWTDALRGVRVSARSGALASRSV